MNLKRNVILLITIATSFPCYGFWGSISKHVDNVVHHVAKAPEVIHREVVNVAQEVAKAPEAVQEVASSIGTDIETLAKDVNIGGALEDAGTFIVSGAETVGKTVEKAVEDAGPFLEESAKAAGKVAEEVGLGVESFVNDNLGSLGVPIGLKDVISSIDEGTKSLPSVSTVGKTLHELISTINLDLNTLKGTIQYLENLVNSLLEDDCHYQCPKEGESPHPKPDYHPDVNGCGSRGVLIPEFVLPNPSMNDCCDKHDRCYDVCGNSKPKCDEQFLSCLFSTCGINILEVTPCHGGATILYSAVRAAGCKSFIDAQSDACICK